MSKIKDFFNRKKLFRTCPRCQTKTLKDADKCPSCKLIFSRLDNATNKQAKKELLGGNRSAVIFNPKCPKDVNRIVLTLLAFFLGAFGAHNFYVGRYPKAVFSLVVSIFTVFYVLYQPAQQIFAPVFSIISILVASMTLMWMFDFVAICRNRYKIPVAVEVKQ